MYDEVLKTAEVIKKGGVILYPTDTIWGVGCSAVNEEAVKKILAIKNRKDSKGMLILLHNKESLKYYVRNVPEIAFELIDSSDTPLTLIYPEGINLAPSLLAEDGSIGVRITRDKFCTEVINQTGVPLVSTSANVSGQPTPSVFTEISDVIKSKVDYITKWRQDDITRSKHSAIIKIEYGGVIKILRN